MYDFKRPFSFHFELTDKCNARCPQCSRNCIEDGVLKEQPSLLLTELSFSDFQNIFKDFSYPVKSFSFCGNFGDPIFVKDIFEITEYSCGDILGGFIHIHTNGGFRSKQWWFEYGKLLSKLKSDNHLVIFSLDGLKDTHHLYRVNTRYDRVLENARAFIEAGGNAEWSFIRFGHNEHQEEEAKTRAKKYGFKSFIPVDTQRFWRREKIDYSFNNKSYKITRSKSEAAKIKKTAAINYSANPEGARVKSKKEIECKVSIKNELFIDCLGNVHPCCWIGSFEYRRRNFKGRVADPHYPDLHEIFEMREIRNAVKENLDDIIEDDFFTHILPLSWNISPCGICARQCGKKVKVVSTKTRELI
tara:strand:- start:42 stop:1118 length:1077 start_codon:yes stop_codon:yes gene_type:complete